MGLDTVSYCLIVRGARAAPTRPSAGSSRSATGSSARRSRKWGTEEQKRDVAAAALPSGEALGCYALTEPGVGVGPGRRSRRAPSATATAGC